MIWESRHRPHTSLDLHRHLSPYAAVVVEGQYLEASVDGVYTCGAGTVILHPGLHAHHNHFFEGGARVLNLPGDGRLGIATGPLLFAITGLSAGALARLGLQDVLEAWKGSTALAPDPPEPLTCAAARILSAPGNPRIGRVAVQLGVSREHLARTFRVRYGMSPAQFRAEQRFRRAVSELAREVPLSELAHRAGYADHAHFARTVRGTTGMSPSRLRSWIKREAESHLF